MECRFRNAGDPNPPLNEYIEITTGGISLGDRITLVIEADVEQLTELREIAFTEVEESKIRGMPEYDLEEILQDLIFNCRLKNSPNSIPMKSPLTAKAAEYAVDRYIGIAEKECSVFDVTLDIRTPRNPFRRVKDRNFCRSMEKEAAEDESGLVWFLSRGVTGCEVAETDAPAPIAHAIEYAVNKPHWERNRKKKQEISKLDLPEKRTPVS